MLLVSLLFLFFTKWVLNLDLSGLAETDYHQQLLLLFWHAHGAKSCVPMWVTMNCTLYVFSLSIVMFNITISWGTFLLWLVKKKLARNSFPSPENFHGLGFVGAKHLLHTEVLYFDMFCHVKVDSQCFMSEILQDFFVSQHLISHCSHVRHCLRKPPFSQLWNQYCRKSRCLIMAFSVCHNCKCHLIMPKFYFTTYKLFFLPIWTFYIDCM